MTNFLVFSNDYVIDEDKKLDVFVCIRILITPGFEHNIVLVTQYEMQKFSMKQNNSRWGEDGPTFSVPDTRCSAPENIFFFGVKLKTS